MATHYSFVTHWQTKAPLPQVWNAIMDAEAWTEWWPDYERVSKISGAHPQNIGSVYDCRLKTPLGYRLCFRITVTAITEHKYMEGTSTGDLDGVGQWLLHHTDGTTYIECRWNVATRVKWMNTFAALLKPAFKWSHHTIMQRGAKGLSARLGVRVEMVG